MGLPPFSTLVDEHGAAVWGYVVALAGPVDAPDLYQDTLLSALRSYPTVRDASNLRAWLCSVARSRAIDRSRARSRRPERLGDVPDAATTTPEIDDALWSAVAALPDKQRHAVVLRYLGDLPYADIAAITETSEAAARQNVRAGLARLKKELS